MSESDEGPSRRKKCRKVGKDDFESGSDSDDSREPTQSLRLRRKKPFELPSRKKAFAAISNEPISPVKISSLKARKRQCNLVKERSEYNQRDGYATDGSNEGEMDDFIDDGDDNDTNGADNTDKSSTSTSDGDGSDAGGESVKVQVRRSPRKATSEHSKQSSRPRKRTNLVTDTPPPSTSDCESEIRDKTPHSRESDDEKEIVAVKRKRKNTVSSSSSDGDDDDESKTDVPVKSKAGRRRGNVVGSDESDDQSLVSWSDEGDVAPLATGKESESASSVTTLTSDACSGSEDNIKSRAAQNAKSRKKKSKKTLKKQLVKLQELKKARAESKKSRVLNAQDPAPLFPPSRSKADDDDDDDNDDNDDDVSIVESGGESDHRMENLPVDDRFDDSDLVLVSHKSLNVCPITKKPFLDGVVNPTCGHKYERTALNDLMQQSVIKGKTETRCPVVGCNRFVPTDLCPNFSSLISPIRKDDDNDNDDYVSNSDIDSNSSGTISGDPEAPYGGYGSCYVCGHRGHWAPGCPRRIDSNSSGTISGDPDAPYMGYGRCYVCGHRGHWAPGCPTRH